MDAALVPENQPNFCRRTASQVVPLPTKRDTSSPLPAAEEDQPSSVPRLLVRLKEGHAGAILPLFPATVTPSAK